MINKQYDYAKAIADELAIDLPQPGTYESLNQFIQQHKTEYYKQRDVKIRETIIHEVKILDFAMELGLSPVKKGKYYSLKEHDSVRIDIDKNCYWRNSISVAGKTQGGSVIDFAQNFTDMSMKEIMTEFSSRISNSQIGMVFPKTESKEKSNELILPPAASNLKNVFAYLNKTRGIEPNIIQYFVKNKMLYMDKHNNCVFVSRDREKPVFASLRGTNTYKRFVGDVKNSNYEKGFFIDNKSSKLFITESVIDAMSVMNILQSIGHNFRNYSYLPLNGATKFESITYHLKKNPEITEIYIGLDNDKSGIENSNEIEKLVKEQFGSRQIELCQLFPQITKDWNEELLYYQKNELSFENFFEDKKKKILQKQYQNYNKVTSTYKNVNRINSIVAYEMDMD